MPRHRGELSDLNWTKLQPLLPPERAKKRGHPWSPHRRIVNGMLWVARTGAPGRDLPRRYGPWKTVYDRFRRWQRNGLWTQILQALQAQEDAAGRLHWDEGSADSTIVRAHQHAAGAPHRPRRAVCVSTQAPIDLGGTEALGRSRGGLTTKIHLTCDAQGRPLGLHLSAGQASDSKQLEATLDTIWVPRRQRGRPRKRVKRLLLDKGYSYRRCRAALRRRKIQALIPERKDQRAARARKGLRGGRPPYFDAGAYQRRSWVERCINRLKQWRRGATRYEKRAESYLAMVTLAAIMIWLN
jgi:transposase